MTLLDTLVDGLSQERIRIRSRHIYTAYCTVVCTPYSVLVSLRRDADVRCQNRQQPSERPLWSVAGLLRYSTCLDEPLAGLCLVWVWVPRLMGQHHLLAQRPTSPEVPFRVIKLVPDKHHGNVEVWEPRERELFRVGAIGGTLGWLLVGSSGSPPPSPLPLSIWTGPSFPPFPSP